MFTLDLIFGVLNSGEKMYVESLIKRPLSN